MPESEYLICGQAVSAICDALEITPEHLLTGKGIDPEYKDADMDYEVTRSDIKILKQIHSLGDAQYKRLMAYMKALQKLEQMENMVEEQRCLTLMMSPVAYWKVL